MKRKPNWRQAKPSDELAAILSGIEGSLMNMQDGICRNVPMTAGRLIQEIKECQTIVTFLRKGGPDSWNECDEFKHYDEESLRLRRLSIGEQHMFVCHSDGSECRDGCDVSHSPSQLALLDAAYESKE